MAHKKKGPTEGREVLYVKGVMPESVGLPAAHRAAVDRISKDLVPRMFRMLDEQAAARKERRKKKKEGAADK